MSDVMLLGVLRMPMPDNPADMGGLEWAQVKDRMRQAADEIEKERAAVDGHIRLIEVLEDEVARLRAELAAEREQKLEAIKAVARAVDMWTAADEKVTKLREALEPFAKSDGLTLPTLAALDRARDVLKEAGGGDE